MKKFIHVALVILAFLAMGVVYRSTFTSPKPFGWKPIIHDAGGRKTITTRDTSEAFTIEQTRGLITLWMDGSTAGLSPASDSCLTVYLLLKNKETSNWGKYHKGTDPTRLDSVARGLINQSNGAVANSDVYFKLASRAEWSWADSAKIVVVIGTSDKLDLLMWAGGQ